MTFQFDASVQEVLVQFGESEIPILQLHVEIEDAISLENVGSRIFVNFDNLNIDDEVSLHLPQYYDWRIPGSHHRTKITSEKTAVVDIYFMMPFTGYEPSQEALLQEWDGKNIFVLMSSQGWPGGTHDPPLVRVTKRENNWKIIRYTSPEFCQFRHNLDSYLKHVSGQTLRESSGANLV